MDRGMLERDHELGRLATAAREAADGAGSVALVHGEAGIGKSSLVKAMSAVLPEHARILIGACDDLATGRPLGPFRDLVGGADGVGEELAKALQGAGDRHRVYDALRSELTSAPLPVVLVVEDVHWADEASLDALRFLVRRMERLPALLVLTYRDDELGREHPLRQLLGQVSRTDRVHRLALPRLSRGAVGRMSRAEGLDPAQVYAVTSGNPFFVAEVLAAGNAGGVPPTVVDAVLARLRGLDAGARDALEQLAVLPSAVEHRLADALLPDALTVLATGEQHGLLSVTPERVVFRHELIRRAIADSLPAARRITLNREVLRALVASPGADPSRIVHHAAQAGDEEAIARFGPVAAADASRTGGRLTV
ncbi:ATP-binding protein, partial [Streptomyces mesophilus]|uniref:ATP-binding protein n=1 Tax=Streptomyces mesophilus TaxID=1775132 RepID=UPI00331C7E3F